MTHRIGIYYEESALRDIMKGRELANFEQDLMMQKLDQIRAEFLQSFGTEGSFEVRRRDTNSRRSRTTFRIVATDAKTGAILKRHPGWLGRFI